jgi:zinc transport system permease protein
MPFLDDFIIRALLGGMGVAIAAGPLGAFVVWRRMAYFGDALAHSALLGVALALILQIHVVLGILIFSLFFAVMIATLSRGKEFSHDTLLGIMAHGALATGLVAVSFVDRLRFDLQAYLFGDILGIGLYDIALIYSAAILTLLVIMRLWNPLLLSSIHSDLARTQGIAVEKVRLVFMILLSLLVALSIKVVGVLLITSLLIIPAATARRFARTPEHMAIGASIIGVIAVVGGLLASLTWDTPAGASIVVATVLCFIVSRVGRV